MHTAIRSPSPVPAGGAWPTGRLASGTSAPSARAVSSTVCPGARPGIGTTAHQPLAEPRAGAGPAPPPAARRAEVGPGHARAGGRVGLAVDEQLEAPGADRAALEEQG